MKKWKRQTEEELKSEKKGVSIFAIVMFCLGGCGLIATHFIEPLSLLVMSISAYSVAVCLLIWLLGIDFELRLREFAEPKSQ